MLVSLAFLDQPEPHFVVTLLHIQLGQVTCKLFYKDNVCVCVCVCVVLGVVPTQYSIQSSHLQVFDTLF